MSYPLDIPNVWATRCISRIYELCAGYPKCMIYPLDIPNLWASRWISRIFELPPGYPECINYPLDISNVWATRWIFQIKELSARNFVYMRYSLNELLGMNIHMSYPLNIPYSTCLHYLLVISNICLKLTNLKVTASKKKLQIHWLYSN